MLVLATLVVVVIVVCVVVALVVVCSICCNCAATFCAHWENVRNATPLLADSLYECVCVCGTSFCGISGTLATFQWYRSDAFQQKSCKISSFDDAAAVAVAVIR